MRVITVIFFSIFVSNINAQEFVSMKHALKVELGLPSAQTNEAYKDFIQGVAYSHVSYQYRIFGNNKLSPIFGAGISANYFDVANYKIVGLNQGGLFSYGLHGKMGLEVIHDENKIMDYHLKFGYFMMESSNRQGTDNVLKKSQHQHFFVEPSINFSFMLDERQGVSFNVGYTFRDMKFKSFHLMMNELPGYASANLNGITGNINFGFGYTLYLQKPKNTVE